MQIFFCDQCSRRVTEGDLADKEGVRIGTLVFCRSCCKRPEVAEYLKNLAAVEEAGSSRQGGHRGTVSRRTPYGGHRRVRPKTPSRGKRPTPRPVRPVSPVPSRSTANGTRRGARATPHRLQKVAPEKSGAELVLYGVVGMVLGFLAAAMAAAFLLR